VAAPLHKRITGWIFDHLLWDTTGSGRQGFWGALWAARKLVAALALSALLTWREWVEHHPPEIVIVELIHFVFVLAVIALFVYIGQRFSHRGGNSPREPEKRP
jgi:hypothetical protein